MATDPDIWIDPNFTDLVARLTALENSGTSVADPLLDAYRDVSAALDEIQTGLTREQSVQALTDAATRIRAV